MAIWPTVPPEPPGTPTSTAGEVLDTIRVLAAVPDGAPADRYATAITDLQHITAAAYKAFAQTMARVQPAGAPAGVISLTNLRALTGASQNAVLGFVRNGRRYQAGGDPTDHSQEQQP